MSQSVLEPTRKMTAATPLQPVRPRTWSLVVCTYRREKVLPRCVRCALASERMPIQVIIVDASPYWETTRAAILGEFESLHRDVEFIYVGARRASLTAQRNQGLEHARGDVSFMIDDDALLFPDTASRIMEIYDADVHNQVVALTPVFAAEVPDAHLNITTPGHPTQGHVGDDGSRGSWLRGLMRDVLWSRAQLLPYDGEAAIPSLPEHLQRFKMYPALFSGGSASFVTAAVREAKFEEVLERYAAGEDWDISERIRHRGLIAYVPTARQCHLEAPGGRLSRRTVSKLRYLNFMALHVLHSRDVAKSRRLYRQMLWRRVLSDALADLVKRNWDIPRARGTWDALKLLPMMFSKTPEEIRQWYPRFQREIIASDRGEDRAR